MKENTNYFRNFDLAVVNSLTKYPSIPTYHTLGDKGVLQEACLFLDSYPVVTEKIDGTNARIVICGGDFLIGSRKEFLYASGDFLANPALGIVQTVLKGMELARGCTTGPEMLVIYGEVYGDVGRVAKNYTTTGQQGFRIFDAWSVPVDEFETMASWSKQRAASWRDNEGACFFTEDQLARLQQALQWGLAPRKQTQDALLVDLIGTYIWLQQFMQTEAVLAGEAPGQSEGVVVRSVDRAQIAKIRFKDYQRALRVTDKKRELKDLLREVGGKGR